MTSKSTCPVVIVTGANTGIGFGICHRLIFQLSSNREQGSDGLTLILACRDKQRAEAAQVKLYDTADRYVRRAKLSPDYDGHAEIFRENLYIATHTIDLADVRSVFRFADSVNASYPYISHLICNAGVTSHERILWSQAIWGFMTDFIKTTSMMEHILQRAGELSYDGLGWVWQCNVFGHYVLFRALEPMMAKYTGSRVLWMSSLVANSRFYDPTDWQLTKSEHPYECSKYQMNMVSIYLDREAVKTQSNGTLAVRHFMVFPGVAVTGISAALVVLNNLLAHIVSYIARFLGSRNHTIDIFKAAISAVYVSLIPLAIPSVSEIAGSTQAAKVGATYSSMTDRWGREFVGTDNITQSREEESQTKELLQNYDRLLKAFCDAQGRASPSG